MQTRPSIANAAPALLLALLWALLALPWLTGQKNIPFDAIDQFYPGVAFAAQSYLRGEWPFWNPYVFAGYPAIADPQGMTFSPSVLLAMLLDSSRHLFNAVVLVHVLIGGLGMLRLIRHCGWSHTAGFLGALVFMFGGVAAARLQHVPMIVTWAFVPWALYLLRALAAAPGWRGAVALGVVGGLAGLQLTQLTFLAALLAGVYALILLCRAEAGSRRPFAGGLALAAAISAVMVAPQAIATFAYLPLTNRAGFDLAAATANSLHPGAGLTLLSPHALGNLRGAYTGRNDLTETLLYIGALPLCLLLAALLRRRSLWADAEARFWLLAALAASAYALGRYTPVYGWLQALLPFATLFRRPPDAMFLFNLALAMAAAAAWQHWFRVSATDGGEQASALERRRERLWLVGVAMFLVAMMLALALAAETAPPWGSLALLVLGTVCVLRAARTAHTQRWLVAALILVALDLRVHNLNNRLNAHRAEDFAARETLQVAPEMTALVAQLRNDPNHPRADIVASPLASAAPLFGIAVVTGYNPLLPAGFQQRTGITASPFEERSHPPGGGYAGPVNDLLGIRWVLTPSQARWTEAALRADAAAFIPRATFPAGDREPGATWTLWENARALPRLLRPSSALAAPAVIDDTALRAIDLTETAYIDAPASEIARCGGRAEAATIVEYRNTTIDIRVVSRSDAWVVLNDIDMPWWRAESDGKPLPIYRANGLFRAVCVPPGESLMRFSFRPFWAILNR